jgi:hypothetical protein
MALMRCVVACVCRKAQEAGDYGEAMMLCVECFQGVESLKDLSVSPQSPALPSSVEWLPLRCQWPCGMHGNFHC